SNEQHELLFSGEENPMRMSLVPKAASGQLCKAWRIVALLMLLAPAAQSQTLKKVDSFDLPGPPGKRFDYLTIDYKHGYLLSAHLGAGLLYVIDLNTNKLVKAIPDVPGIEGVEYA